MNGLLTAKERSSEGKAGGHRDGAMGATGGRRDVRAFSEAAGCFAALVYRAMKSVVRMRAVQMTLGHSAEFTRGRADMARDVILIAKGEFRGMNLAMRRQVVAVLWWNVQLDRDLRAERRKP